MSHKTKSCAHSIFRQGHRQDQVNRNKKGNYQWWTCSHMWFILKMETTWWCYVTVSWCNTIRTLEYYQKQGIGFCFLFKGAFSGKLPYLIPFQNSVSPPTKSPVQWMMHLYKIIACVNFDLTQHISMMQRSVSLKMYLPSMLLV